MSKNASVDGDRPLDIYEHRGYAVNPEGELDDSTKALDAAIALTASRWGPPFNTPYISDAEWWIEGYQCAARSVEEQIVDALLTRAGGQDHD